MIVDCYKMSLVCRFCSFSKMPNSGTPGGTRSKRRRRRRGPSENPARNELVSSSLESAKQCLFHQDFGTAFVHYLLALNLDPTLKDEAKVRL